MEHVTLTVTGIKKNEYQQACALNNRRMYGILAVAMIIICGIIMLATGNISARAILGPVVVFIIFVTVIEVLTRATYKGQLEEIDPVEYDFGPSGWSVSSAGKKLDFKWEGTPKIKKTRDCVFVYNNEASSNLLPRRLLADEQITRLEQWFMDSRKMAKEYEKEQTRKEREEFRKNHHGLRLGRTGPAWGPWKRNKKI